MAPLHPFIPVPGVVRVALEGTQAGRPFANVFHVQYTGGPPSATVLADYGTEWYNTVTGDLGSIAGATVTYEDAVLTDLSSIAGAQVTVGSTLVGSLAGDVIPANSAALANYNSSFRYRGGHPRTYYVAGTQDSLLNPNTWSDAFVTSVTTVAEAVTAAFGSGGEGGFVPIGQCAVSYISADVHRAVPVVMPITRVVVSSGIATMRRRMRK